MSAAAHREEMEGAEHFISASAAMQAVHKAMAQLANNDLSVMITGDAGTGKELLARALHYMSGRKAGPFVAVKPGALPPEAAEKELFGRDNRIAQAKGGTLLLHDVSALSPGLQIKLLQFLKSADKADVRLICTTSRNLAEMVAKKEFSEDLYYRLNVVPLSMPRLGDRREDIPGLARYFLRKAREKGLPDKILDAETVAAMQQHGWPGNVRELEHMIYRLCMLCPESIIGKEAFLAEIARDRPAPPAVTATTLERDVEAHLRQYFEAHSGGGLPPPGLYDRILPLVEKPLLEMTLRQTGGNQVKAAYVLGINRNTLRKKLAGLGIRT